MKFKEMLLFLLLFFTSLKGPSRQNTVKIRCNEIVSLALSLYSKCFTAPMIPAFKKAPLITKSLFGPEVCYDEGAKLCHFIIATMSFSTQI